MVDRPNQGLWAGNHLGGHVPGTRLGLVPDTTYYDNIYGKRHWTYRTIYSISIGAGIACHAMHMANLAAIMANKGYYYEPHLVRISAARANPRICKSGTTLALTPSTSTSSTPCRPS